MLHRIPVELHEYYRSGKLELISMLSAGQRCNPAKATCLDNQCVWGRAVCDRGSVCGRRSGELR